MTGHLTDLGRQHAERLKGDIIQKFLILLCGLYKHTNAYTTRIYA